MTKKILLMKISPQDARGISQIYIPKYDSDLEASKKLPLGQEVSGGVADGDLRNYRHHKKYFALLKFAFHHMPEKYESIIKSVEDLRQEILMQTGFREKRVSMSGREYYVPKSMKFDKMGSTEFEELYNATFDFICQYILVGLDDKTIEEELMSFL